LKLVSTIQKIGKNITNATTTRERRQISHVRDSYLARIAHASSFGRRPHQEEGDDIGKHDRDHAAGRGAADVELDERLAVDQEREIGGLQLPGPPEVVTKISANTVSRKIVSIMMTTLIARARCGSVM
jgi:hypothetical protein